MQARAHLQGTLVQISGDSDGRWIGAVDRIIQALMLSPFVSQKMAGFTVKPNEEDLRFLKQLIEAGTLTPLIDRTYPLGETPEAIRYLENGHARGKVIISVPGGERDERTCDRTGRGVPAAGRWLIDRSVTLYERGQKREAVSAG